jgi:hypothetical protein
MARKPPTRHIISPLASPPPPQTAFNQSAYQPYPQPAPSPSFARFGQSPLASPSPQATPFLAPTYSQYPQSTSFTQFAPSPPQEPAYHSFSPNPQMASQWTMAPLKPRSSAFPPPIQPHQPPPVQYPSWGANPPSQPAAFPDSRPVFPVPEYGRLEQPAPNEFLQPRPQRPPSRPMEPPVRPKPPPRKSKKDECVVWLPMTRHETDNSEDETAQYCSD